MNDSRTIFLCSCVARRINNSSVRWKTKSVISRGHRFGPTGQCLGSFRNEDRRQIRSCTLCLNNSCARIIDWLCSTCPIIVYVSYYRLCALCLAKFFLGRRGREKEKKKKKKKYIETEQFFRHLESLRSFEKVYRAGSLIRYVTRSCIPFRMFFY